jgi:hypothetical protein
MQCLPQESGCSNHAVTMIARRVPGEPSAAVSSPDSSAISSLPSQTSNSALTVC